MKVPPKRKGNDAHDACDGDVGGASMKVPPKRKGNFKALFVGVEYFRLNESPSQKEGK